MPFCYVSPARGTPSQGWKSRACLTPGGQVLCDSSDISYVFEGDLPDMDYYGEQSFRMQYKDTIGEPFPWLYIDAGRLKLVAEENGYAADVVEEGEHYDYLARITKQ